MAEVMVRFENPVMDADGAAFTARACGRPIEEGRRWEGWVEFTPLDGGTVLRTSRETVQPNRPDLEYWATGLGAAFLEGALHRAREPRRPKAAPPAERPAYDGPAPAGGGGSNDP